MPAGAGEIHTTGFSGRFSAVESVSENIPT